EIYEQTVNSRSNFAQIITLYGSENDIALIASRYAHSPNGQRVPRAGDGGKSILIIDGTDSIDTSEIRNKDPMGHSYIFDEPQVVLDAKSLVLDLRNAAQRRLSRRMLQGRIYWSIDP